ncbi:transcriptional regulator [Deinococcus hopiensis]|uniref:Sigma E regulatory protein, MucB/RseB n=1 Tax=Deinococcus hopiensis KR-140 TaxID=695939 RepID=A0A1W1VSN5_9DEIO|nr:transcriptional regulator [Deinococcus hopiensis]SMB96240.1 sigma E regulatory protein, MucB/RseB [Deinococcus hopiensis KR-140]
MRRGAWLVALLPVTAGASDLDDLTAVLRQARTHTARGTVEVSVFFPPREVPTRLASVLPTVPFRPALLGKNFNVTQQPASPVAGRDVTRFALVPKVGQAARWTLWVDRTWNVPLAFEERMPDGTLARRATFTQIEPRLAARTLKVPGVPSGLGAALRAALPGLRPPPGFVPTAVATRKAGGLEVTLGDGANVLALVLAPRSVRAAPGVASRQVGGRFVWLVGNLPGTDLQAALSGIRRVDDTPLGTFLPPTDSKD